MTFIPFQSNRLSQGEAGLREALTNFLDSPLGKLVENVLDFLAALLLIYGVGKMIRKLYDTATKGSGLGATAAKDVVLAGAGPLLGALLLFQFEWVFSIIGFFASVLEILIQQIQDLLSAP